MGAAELEVRRLAANGILHHRLDRSHVLVHAQPVDRRRPDRAEVEPERLVVGEEHRLRGDLRRSVEVGARARVGEQDRVVGVDRLVHDPRQHSDRREVDHAGDAEGDHGLDEVHDAADVDLERGRPVRRQVGGIEDHSGVHHLVGSVHAEHVEHPRLVADRGKLDTSSASSPIVKRASGMKSRTSSTTTRRPVSSSARTRLPPMKPAPPGDQRRPLGDWLAGCDRRRRCRPRAAPSPARSAARLIPGRPRE